LNEQLFVRTRETSMFKPLACVAAALLAAPAAATSFAELPPAAAVAAFAAQRGEAPLWLRDGPDGPAIRRLVATLRQAPLDGLAAGPQLAAASEAAVERARSGGAVERAEAERMLSAAWVMYVQALHWPTAGMIYADSAVAPKIPKPATILTQLASAQSLAGHVEQVSAINPLYADLRAALAKEADPQRRRTLQANLDRARGLPAGGRYILVDLAAQRLWMMEEGRPADSMKVVVGKAEMKTPLIAGTVRTATLNPYWNVPADLVRRSIAPAAAAGGAAYLQAKGYELLSGWQADARPLSPDQVDWLAVADGRTEVRVRQEPGPGNMMGAVKFEFAPAQGIYLHDTPDKSLFAREVRTFSSGCIRLEDAARLGRWLMGRELVAQGNAPEQVVNLPQAVPVYVTYLTARVEGGQVALAADVYGLDQATHTQLASR
jgi:murein L,D-transpeptidase YcbB/YkuD